MGLFGNRDDEDEGEDDEEVVVEEEPDTICNFQMNWDEDTEQFECGLVDTNCTIICEGRDKCPFWNKTK